VEVDCCPATVISRGSTRDGWIMGEKRRHHSCWSQRATLAPLL